ncbi:hypothetical protein H2203_005136 [Taxawa tesnikishii (nom. ined.)]|nr:hypothetical protein H2203_005136 [Dothideales sp. JES 119]
MVDDTFNPFARLPTELREEIWRFCLPHRVSEMDYPADFMVYDSFDPEDKLPCSLRSTSISNGRPPLLTRVCRESRRIAFESGNWVSVFMSREAESPYRPREAEWDAMNLIDRDYWQDPSRDSAHLNWTTSYRADLGCTTDGHPLNSLVRESKRLNGSASIMLGYMSDSLMELEPFDKPIARPLESIPIPHSKQEDLAALKLLPEWLVVTRVVIIHLDFARAAKTGLFGLSGDEFVQVVDATLPLASQLYELAEICEREAYAVTAAQNFARMSANDMDAMVKRVALKAFHDHELSKRMRPAIMFRLCTQMCNHSNTLGEERNV